MPRIPASSSSSPPKDTRLWWRRAFKAIMRSHRFRIPRYDMPLRLRPWFMAFTCIIMSILALSGLINLTGSMVLPDELLHFFCFWLATETFYFIIDVEEDARRIWFWRHSSLVFTILVCFFLGGIVSEVVQAMLPFKKFRPGAVLANLSGSAVGLYIAYHFEKYYRRRREISRLYRPINTEYLSDSDDDMADAGTQLLPMHNQDNARPSKPSKASTPFRLADVWDEREEVFGVGDDSEDENDTRPPATSHGEPPPRIVVSGSDL